MKKIIFLVFSLFIFSGNLFAQYKSYRVKEDETIDSITKKFKVDKKDILKLNPDLKKDNLAHQVVVIPASETDKDTPNATSVQFKEYRVKHKETLYSLAKENDISVDDIKEYNPYLLKEELGEDDMIRIPIFENDKKDFNSSVSTSSFKNLIHVVRTKETKFGISKQYGLSVEELEELNPQIKTEEIQPGQFLKVKNKATKSEEEDDFEFYEVQPKETMYSLTKELGISEDSLEQFNPILKELGLQAGMELKIPKDSASEGSSDLDKIKSSKKTDLAKHLKNKSEKQMIVMLPFNLHNFQKDSVEQADLLRKDPYLQYSLDLQSGIKAAVDSIQKLGISVNVKVFDTQKDKSKIKEILKDKSFKKADFIFGPLLPDHLKIVAESLDKTPIFSPLIDAEIKGNKNIFQSRPSTKHKEDMLLSYVDSLASNKNLLLLSDSKHKRFKDKFLKRFSDAKEIKQAQESYLQKEDLTKVLSKDQPNWVFIETDDYGAIANAVSFLNAMRNDYEIRLFTSDKNSVVDAEVENEFLSHLNFTFASVGSSDVIKEKNTFVKYYLNKHGIMPNSTTIRGFDVAFDALLRSSTDKDIYKSLKKRKGLTEYVENRFDYQDTDDDGHYNNAVYLIKFDEDLQLSILN